MIRNHNGYWMDPRFMSPDTGSGGGGAGDAGTAGDNAPGGDAANTATGGADNAPGAQNNPDAGTKTDDNSTDALNAEIARLKAEMAKQKDALNKATSEAGKYRKELQSRKTQEEIDADAKAEAAEKAAKELEELRREVAKGKTVKSVMGKLGMDEESAGNLADHLVGAADIENALLEIQKSWQKREAALRKEFGKITGPGTGADSNSPEAMAIKRAQEIGKARSAVNEQAQKAMSAYIR